ncbi:hypothetical protein T440DRAFT_136249 [Plenodomus tracheiphilus IPT5]|uniref:Uncharacterized protein n=1 Tax=Plenodomus tracheiphilus IPT5 TaxID=1408161 RepID=A0A6A7B3Z2_9PLEO|nr:hypothetical protein T440DRAFT_136249 [Plenodomus tracheiphilus IPT5]
MLADLATPSISASLPLSCSYFYHSEHCSWLDAMCVGLERSARKAQANDVYCATGQGRVGPVFGVAGLLRRLRRCDATNNNRLSARWFDWTIVEKKDELRRMYSVVQEYWSFAEGSGWLGNYTLLFKPSVQRRNHDGWGGGWRLAWTRQQYDRFRDWGKRWCQGSRKVLRYCDVINLSRLYHSTRS